MITGLTLSAAHCTTTSSHWNIFETTGIALSTLSLKFGGFPFFNVCLHCLALVLVLTFIMTPYTENCNSGPVIPAVRISAGARARRFIRWNIRTVLEHKMTTVVD